MTKLGYILIHKMHFKITPEEFKDLSGRVAEELADPVMFNWKIWMLDEEKNIGVTEYYLNTKEQVEEIIDYLNTMSLLYTTFLGKSETEVYEILDVPTRLNFGPINAQYVSPVT